MINNLSALNWLMGKVHKDDDCNLEAWLTLTALKVHGSQQGLMFADE